MAPRLFNDKNTDAQMQIIYEQKFDIVVRESVQLQLVIR